MADLRIDIASVFSGAKAFKQADSATAKLNKSVTKLAGAFGLAFSTRAIVQFGKASVQAFAADEKAAKSLSVALQNTGNGFATIATEGFIARMQQTYRVLDDELRPAFQTLLTATGSITKAQQGLELALDVSAGTTKDLASVSQALARGYAGNTQGLSRLNAGLDKAILKTGDMEKITAVLTSKFRGQALSALDTYAKKMDALTVAAANSKEIIGKGLLDSIQALGGDDGITKAADGMEVLSQNVSDTVLGMALLISKVKELGSIDIGPNSGKFAGLLAATLAGAGVGALLGGGVGAVPGAFVGLTSGLTQQRLQAAGTKSREAKTPFSSTSMYFTPQQAENAKIAADKLKADKAALKLAKEQAILLAKQTKAIKEQTGLKRAGTLFDLEQTQVIAALQSDITADERKRLELQLALLTGNTAEASLLAGKLAYSQGLTKELVAYFKNLPDAKNPFAGWAAYLDAIEEQVKKIAVSTIPSAITNVVSSGVTSNFGDIGLGDMTDFIPANPSFNQAFPATVKVDLYVDGTMLADAITVKQTNDSLSGNKISINRRSGSFAETPTP
jgi:uncharacterized protein YcfJ